MLLSSMLSYLDMWYLYICFATAMFTIIVIYYFGILLFGTLYGMRKFYYEVKNVNEILTKTCKQINETCHDLSNTCRIMNVMCDQTYKMHMEQNNQDHIHNMIERVIKIATEIMSNDIFNKYVSIYANLLTSQCKKQDICESTTDSFAHIPCPTNTPREDSSCASASGATTKFESNNNLDNIDQINA